MSKEKVAHDSEGFSDGLQRPDSQHGSTYPSSHMEDAVFGEVSEGGPNYRNVCLASRIHRVSRPKLIFTK